MAPRESATKKPRRTSRKSAARSQPGLRRAAVRLGKRIRELREEQGLTQEALAQAARIDDKHLQDVERAVTPNPTLSTLLALSRALEVTLADLVRGIDSGGSR